MIRAFLALPVPAEVRSRLAVLQFLLPLPRKAEPAGFHLTLSFLGEVPDSVLVSVDDAMRFLRQDGVALRVEGAGLFGGARPTAVWAAVKGGEPLERLQAKCDRIARQAGARIEARRFLPHITLGRFSPPNPEDALRLERAVAAESGFLAGPWVADRVVLYRSILTKAGSVYEALADYPLRTVPAR
jgi:2'-5' RNA ligase